MADVFFFLYASSLFHASAGEYAIIEK